MAYSKIDGNDFDIYYPNDLQGQMHVMLGRVGVQSIPESYCYVLIKNQELKFEDIFQNVVFSLNRQGISNIDNFFKVFDGKNVFDYSLPKDNSMSNGNYKYASNSSNLKNLNQQRFSSRGLISFFEIIVIVLLLCMIFCVVFLNSQGDIMNLNRFVDQYGNFSFDEVPFNEIDNVIFASLSYLSLDNYVSHNSFSPKRLQCVAYEFFRDYSKKDRYVYAVRKAIKLLGSIKDVKRYKDLFLYNYVYESGVDEQFSAFTIEIDKKTVYVSFEGTDQLISGWKEDFMFSYVFPTISQRKAINYVNSHFTFRWKKIILGGHSKGGNLALVAGMCANFWVKRRIIKIYNNDGPGLLKEQLESKSYLSIKDRLVNIVPNYSMVGILLNSENKRVIRSMKKGFLSHDVFCWVVKDKEFEQVELSPYSKSLNDKIELWIEKYDFETRRKFVESQFSVFDRADVTSIVDFFDNKKLILKFILETKGIDKEVSKMVRDFIFMMFQTSSEVKIDEIKMMFQKKGKE